MNFDNFMTNAPEALFKLGWILAVVTFFASIVPALFMGQGQAFLPAIFVGAVAAISAVLIPWISAAVLWRIDRFLEARK